MHAKPPEVGGVLLKNILRVVAPAQCLIEGRHSRGVPLAEHKAVAGRPFRVFRVVRNRILPEDCHDVTYRQVTADVDSRLAAEFEQVQPRG
ncbi:hypothetical protein SDC9_92448 [bioreactor metagenome]|uniref:Uncharacterized protein n=1 Tax=bioreactor metagenome TaxID=1076179 RepID=A0A644ZYH1_9ZZZZ